MRREDDCYLAGEAAVQQRKPHQEALTAQQCLEMLVAEAQDAILVLDEQHTIRFANPAAGKLFPAHHENLVGQPFGHTAIGCAVTELDVPQQNGRVLTVEMRASNTTWRGEPARLVVLHDVTERKLAETALRKAHDDLEKRVRERTAQLTETNRRLMEEIRVRKQAEKELNRRNEELEQFTFIAAHDLQEPLRKILVFSSRMVSDYGDAIEEKGRDYIARMGKAVKRMQDLVGSLLLYSKMVNNPAPFRRIELREIVQDVLGSLEEQIEQAGLRLEVEDLPVIEADPHQIRWLFHELIQNALKFRGKSNPTVTIRLDEPGKQASGRESAPVPGGMCRILIEDNGIGFNEQYLDRVFRPLQCLNKRCQYDGTGIGLTICRRIAERHGGSITAKSKPGHGATFIIILPEKQPSEELQRIDRSRRPGTP
jgi:signal transduction histidine kinase